MAITPISAPIRYVNSVDADYTESSETSFTIEVRNNTWYSFPTITSLTLTANSSLFYAGMDLVSGSTATTINYPSTWIWEGDDCDEGDFTPLASTLYRVAIELSHSFDTYVCTVQSVTNKSAST